MEAPASLGQNDNCRMLHSESAGKKWGMNHLQFLLPGIIKLDCKPAAIVPRLAPAVCDGAIKQEQAFLDGNTGQQFLAWQGKRSVLSTLAEDEG